MRCNWPPDSEPITRALEPGQPDGRQRLLDSRPLGAADAAKGPEHAPQPHRDEVADRDRERAVDLGQLRQVGDVAPVEAAAADTAFERTQHPGDALEQGRLARPVGADHRQQGALRHLALQMVDGGMAVVAESEVLEHQRRRGDAHVPVTISVASHSAAASSEAIRRRVVALVSSKSVPRARGRKMQCYNITS